VVDGGDRSGSQGWWGECVLMGMNSFIERNRESIYREHRDFIKGYTMGGEKVQKMNMTRGEYKIRNEGIWQLRKLGCTYQEIAGEYNISSERVQQILAKKRRMLHRVAADGAVNWDTPIDVLKLSVRTYNALTDLGLETLQDMKYLTEVDFLRQRNFGRKSLNELKYATRELKWAS
jgi:hypothetical protein